MAVTKLSNSGIKTGILKYDSMLAGNAAYDPAATWLIARTAGTGSSNTITFSSIPSTYQHLQIRFLAKSSTTTSINESVLLRINGDSATNYVEHYLFGGGTSATAGGAVTRSSVSIYNGAMRSNATYANIMGVGIVDIHDYLSTTKNKTVRYFCGNDVNAAASVGPALGSGLWLSTSAVSSISLITTSGNWTTTSSFALYGFKG